MEKRQDTACDLRVELIEIFLRPVRLARRSKRTSISSGKRMDMVIVDLFHGCDTIVAF